MVGSYYLAIRDRAQFCWTQHVCAPYSISPMLPGSTPACLASAIFTITSLLLKVCAG